ncbi:MAG: glycosyltransferase family 39 protein [Anaerolineae bacterium]|nr:glycosyltransferase family 39 protein [Anaerolineae bacterium]
MMVARRSRPASVLLLGLVLAAWAWRLYGLDAQSLWRDETDSLRFATRPLAQALAMFSRPGENGPLFFLVLRPWLALAGHSEFALRFPSALAGVLAIPLVYRWGSWLHTRRMGLIAALLLAFNPYHLWYSQEAKMYALVVTAVLAVLWAFVRAMERGGWWRWAVWLALTSLGFYLHVLVALVIPLQVSWVLLVPRWRRRWRAFGAALAVLVLPYLPLIGWQWTLLTDPDFATGHAFVPLGRMLLVTWAAQLAGIPVLPGMWVLAPAVFLLLAGLFLRPFHPYAGRLLAAWWLVPLLSLYFICLVTPLYTDRYLIWTLPAQVLLMAWGVVKVGERRRELALALLGGWLAFQLGVGWQQMHVPIKSDFRAAAAYVAPRRQPGDVTLFLMPYIRHTYRYYDPGPYPWLEAPYANRPEDAAQVPERLAAMLADYKGVWLIESEADFYDREGRIRRWLESHGRREDAASFTRVAVFYYRLRP